MTYPYMNLPRDFALDDNAAALPGALLYVYDAGTTTPRTIYSNAAGSATHTNPLVADAAGRFAAWFLNPAGGDYKITLKDADGVTIYTVDNLPVTPITATAETTPTAPSTPVESATSSFTLGVGEVSKVWNIDPTSGDVTVTLTAATGVDDGLWALIRHKGTAGRVIITDGTPNKIRRVLDVPGESVVVVSDNVNWYTISEAGEVRLPAQGWVTCADYTTTPPSGPTAGTKYLAAVGASSPWTEKRIYEANGVGGWTEFVPETGWCAYVQDENVLYVFNGSNWIPWTNATAPTATYLGRALFREEQAQNTAGGTPTANAWTKATLNTTISNNITGVSISSSVITFTGVTGKFLIRATRSFYATAETQIRLRDTTNSVNLGVSPQLYAANYTSGTGPASILGSVSPVVAGVIGLTGTTTNIELQYYVTNGPASGLGRVRNVSGENEVYGQLEILDLTAQQGPAGSTGATGSGYGGTSTSSVAIGSSGTKTWTTQSGYAYVAGQRVRVAYDASNYIEGTVSSYSGTTFSITADRSVGSGTYTSWTIGAAGDVGATGTAGTAGAAGAAATISVGSTTTGAAGSSASVTNSGSSSAATFNFTIPRGDTGATGPNTGLDYAFNTATSGDPGAGKVLFNSATIASVTQVNISETGRNSEALAAVIATWDDSTNTAHYGHLRIFDVSDRTKFIELEISGTITDAGSYRTIPVTYTAGGTLPSNNAILAVMFERTGDKGSDGAGTGDVSAAATFGTDNVIIRSDGTSKGVQSSAVAIDDTTGTLYPTVSDSGALGSTTKMWGDLFLASGAVINFNNGDVTITHSSDALAVAGGDSGYSFAHSGAADTPGLSVTHGGTTLKWSHGNTNFIGSLGALSGGGAPFVAWHAEHSSTANTLKNSGAGVKGLYAQWDGTTFDIIINGVATASANFSSAVTGLSMTAAGAVTIASDFSNGTSAKVSTGTIELGHATDTTLSRSAAGELAVEGTLVKKVGKETIFIPASAMISRTTNGAAAGTVETTTNKVMFSTLDFDTTTQEFSQFSIRMPKSWNESTITAAFTWSHASTTTNFGVVWALEAVALSDDDAGDTAFGTAQQVADTGGTTNDIYVTSATSAITIAGTPAAEDWVVFQVKRVPSAGSDTMAIDARLHGVTLYYTTDASTDA